MMAQSPERLAAGWAALACYGVTACRRCGTTAREHGGRGLCRHCYDWVAHRWSGTMATCPYPLLIAARHPEPKRVRGAVSLAPTRAALRAIGGPRARTAYRLLMAARRAGIPLEEVLGTSCERTLTESRRILAYLLVRRAGLTRTAAGEVLQRDHSTICHHLDNAERLLARGDVVLAARLDEVVRESIPATDGIYRPEHPRTIAQAVATRRRLREVAS